MNSISSVYLVFFAHMPFEDRPDLCAFMTRCVDRGGLTVAPMNQLGSLPSAGLVFQGRYKEVFVMSVVSLHPLGVKQVWPVSLDRVIKWALIALLSDSLFERQW